MKLFTKIFLVLLVVFLVSGFMISFFVFNLTFSDFKELVGNDHSRLAENIMNEIDETLYERYLDIQMIASNKSIKDYILLNLNHESTTTDQNRKSLLMQELQSSMTLSGPWDSLSVYDQQFKLIISTSDNIESSKFEKMAIDSALNGQVYYSDVFLFKNTKPTMIFSAPVYSDKKFENSIVGVVLGYFSWPAIIDILQRFKLPYLAYLYNQNGQLIASSQENKINLLSVNDFVQQNILKKISKTSNKFSIDIGIFKKFKVLSSSSPQNGYLDYKGNSWNLLLEIPVKTAFTKVRESSMKIIFLFMVVFMIIGAIVIFLIWKLLIKPIKHLYKIMNKIINGHFDERVRVESKDELGELAKIFNKLMDDLSNIRINIEKKILRRNKQLEKMNKYMLGRELRMMELKEEIKKLKNK